MDSSTCIFTFDLLYYMLIIYKRIPIFVILCRIIVLMNKLKPYLLPFSFTVNHNIRSLSCMKSSSDFSNVYEVDPLPYLIEFNG